MESRAVIEQATGIIIGERRCSPEEAFAILSRLSQDTNRKLRDVASALVENAHRPPLQQTVDGAPGTRNGRPEDMQASTDGSAEPLGHDEPLLTVRTSRRPH